MYSAHTTQTPPERRREGGREGEGEGGREREKEREGGGRERESEEGRESITCAYKKSKH